jgi:Uma2 family endonuclease
MATLIEDRALEEQLIAQRREWGADRFDEVWDGVYFRAPLPNNEHADIQAYLVTILTTLVRVTGAGLVYGGVNVTDKLRDWSKNYRCPDVVVYLNDTAAENRGTHWLGGPDFAVEIVSAGDRSREKIGFYASVGVRELLIIDRDPWQLELFRLIDDHLRPVAIATQANCVLIESQVVPISLRLVTGTNRPSIQVRSREGQGWSI